MKIAGSVIPVCVIIPCFRCSATIRRAVDSVFAQSAIPAEIVLVEDCSGDDTLIALLELERQFPGRIKLVQMKVNGGAASARNAGWATTKQPYIAFLDADDSWHPEKLHIQYEYMQSHPEVALSGHQCVLMRDNEILGLPCAPSVSLISSRSLLFKNAFSTTSPIMLKNSMPFRFKEDMRFSEDFLLWLQIAFSGLKVVRIETPLSYTYKSMYGESGLSAQLWKMEKGELSNFSSLYQAGRINLLLLIAASCFSIIKFVRRLFFTSLRQAASPMLRKGGAL